MLTLDELGAMVQHVLNHLYDPGYLQSHPLGDYLQHVDPRLRPRERMRALRTTMLELIEELNPGPDVPFRSLRARSYSVLNLHYVEGMTVQETSRELAISERQLYRDLRRAERSLAQILASRMCAGNDAASTVLTRSSLLREELDRLRANVEEVDIGALVDGAVASVRSLCQQHEVRVEATQGARAGTIVTDPLLARQIIVSILSWAVQSSPPGSTVRYAASDNESKASIVVYYTPSQGIEGAGVVPDAVQSLAEHLGGDVGAARLASGQVRCSLVLGGACELEVLVVDDNVGMLALFQRYVADQGYRLIGAQNGVEGLRLAEEGQPDVIILDVMMPRQDGWEVLQLLQNRPTTRHIPVIVCSVLNDPELAFSLGAAEFLPKPVTRARLLGALARCAAHSPAP